MWDKTLKDFLKLNMENIEELLEMMKTEDEERNNFNGRNLLQLLSGKNEVNFFFSRYRLLYIRLSDYDESEGAWHIYISFHKLGGNYDEDKSFHFLHYEDFDIIKIISDYLYES